MPIFDQTFLTQRRGLMDVMGAVFGRGCREGGASSMDKTTFDEYVKFAKDENGKSAAGLGEPCTKPF